MEMKEWRNEGMKAIKGRVKRFLYDRMDMNERFKDKFYIPNWNDERKRVLSSLSLFRFVRSLVN